MKIIFKILCLLICTVMLTTVFGCDGGTDTAIIYYGINEIPSKLDPQTAQNTTERLIVRNIFEGLLRFDESGNITNGIAESYQTDGLTYTFKIRKDAMWNDETKITAHDFVFAFRRAVDPETNSPDAQCLFKIKNARQIFSGNMTAEKLGVSAIDEDTFQIELCENDDDLLTTLTLGITMPCNEKFFRESKGKYGMSAETLLTNGSFYLSKWNVETSAIRMRRNNSYSGNSPAKSAAVFLSYDKDTSCEQQLKENTVDITIFSGPITENTDALYKTVKNNVWLLALGSGYSDEMTSALQQSVVCYNSASEIPSGYTAAYLSAPDFFGFEIKNTYTPYNIENAKKLYKNAVKTFQNSEFPTHTIYYYNAAHANDLAKSVAGHWQQNLGAFINITPISSVSQMEYILESDPYSIVLYPITVSVLHTEKYYSEFKLDVSRDNIPSISDMITLGCRKLPIAFSDTVIAYSPKLLNVNIFSTNGIIDFSYIVKKQ